MLDALFSGDYGQQLTVKGTLIIVFVSLLLGLVISLTYIVTHQKEGYVRSYPVTMVMLPAIIAIIILLVGNNMARAFSLAGAFTIIRFRSAPSDPKDIAYVFFTLAAGLACGIGYVGYAVMFTIILCVVMIILQSINFGQPGMTVMNLKITVPEELNFKGAFDDILDTYTRKWYLRRIRTTDFGELFEISYRVDFKKEADQKEFVDAIRCRNGNLTVALTLIEDEQRLY